MLIDRAIAFQTQAIAGKCPGVESHVALSLPKGLKIFPSARFQVRKLVLGAGFRFFDLAQNDPNYNAIALC